MTTGQNKIRGMTYLRQQPEHSICERKNKWLRRTIVMARRLRNS